MSFEQFLADDRTFDAVIRNLQIIGEAAKNVPQEMRLCYSEIEWRKITGLRDVLAHIKSVLTDILHQFHYPPGVQNPWLIAQVL